MAINRQPSLRKASPVLLTAALICLLLGLAADCLWCATVSVKLTAGEYSIHKGTNGDDILTLDSYATDFEPGNPMLPVKVSYVLLPPTADLSTLSMKVDDMKSKAFGRLLDIGPAPPAVALIDTGEVLSWGRGKSIVGGRNMLVYGTDDYYPREHA